MRFLAVKAPELFAELFDFRLGDIFFVLGFGELFGNVFHVTQDPFERFTNPFDFGFGLLDERTLFRWKVRIALFFAAMFFRVTARTMIRPAVASAIATHAPIAG